MHRTQILLEEKQHETLTEIARQENRTVSDVVREMVDKEIAERKQRALAAAAQALLEDYKSDPELTAFQSLDGEDFSA
jgi:predicted DNA-binding ribbon-helix-helix protein